MIIHTSNFDFFIKASYQYIYTHQLPILQSNNEEGGERKRNKSDATIAGEEETHQLKDTCVPIEKCGEEENAAEKKRFLEKIKEKLHKKGTEEEEEEVQCPAAVEQRNKGGEEEKEGYNRQDQGEVAWTSQRK